MSCGASESARRSPWSQRFRGIARRRRRRGRQERRDVLLDAAAQAGPSVKPHYFAFLAENFPALLPSTEARFADRVNPQRCYFDALEERAHRVRLRYAFKDRPFRRAAEPAAPSQLRLTI